VDVDRALTDPPTKFVERIPAQGIAQEWLQASVKSIGISLLTRCGRLLKTNAMDSNETGDGCLIRAGHRMNPPHAPLYSELFVYDFMIDKSRGGLRRASLSHLRNDSTNHVRSFEPLL
jgi:hypothetical protein